MREDDEDEIMALNEGMTQKRGEASQDSESRLRESNDVLPSAMTRASQCSVQG